MNRYDAQIKDFLKIGGEAFWWEVVAGFGATLLSSGQDLELFANVVYERISGDFLSTLL